MDPKDGACGIADLPNESAMTLRPLSSLSSNRIVDSNLKFHVPRSRSLEECYQHDAATSHPQELLLMKINLKLGNCLQNLNLCKNLPALKICDEHRCPLVRQRLYEHQQRCHSTAKKKQSNINPSKGVECKPAESYIKKVSYKPQTCDESLQTSFKKSIKDMAINCGSTEARQSIENVAVKSNSILSASTMTGFEFVRRTQSCNTIVSFKDFYKDRLQYEVLQWLREVPIEAKFNSTTRKVTEAIVNNLIEEINKLAGKVNSNTYEAKLKRVIEDCLTSLPLPYHSAKCDKIKRILTESLITRIVLLNRRYSFSSKNSLYSCGFNDFETYRSSAEDSEVPLIKVYRKAISSWLQSKQLKRKDGDEINIADLTENLLDRLLPLLYDKEAKNSKYLMRGEIIEVLNKLCLSFPGKNDRLYLNGFACELARILLKSRTNFQPSLRSSARIFLSNTKNFLRQLLKRKNARRRAEKLKFSNDKATTASYKHVNSLNCNVSQFISLASSTRERAYSNPADLKIKDDFHSLSILYARFGNSKKFITSNLLNMTLNFVENINTRLSREYDVSGSAIKKNYTEECALEIIYDHTRLWMENKSNNGSVNKKVKRFFVIPNQSVGKNLRTQNISEKEPFTVTIRFKLVINCGSLKNFNGALEVDKKNDILEKLIKTPFAKDIHGTSLIFDSIKNNVARDLTLHKPYNGRRPSNITIKKLSKDDNRIAKNHKPTNNHNSDREVTAPFNISSQNSSVSSSQDYYSRLSPLTFDKACDEKKQWNSLKTLTGIKPSEMKEFFFVCNNLLGNVCHLDDFATTQCVLCY